MCPYLDYDPNEEEGEGFGVWPDGLYAGSIEEVNNKLSKSSGKPMQEAILRVWKGGENQKVWVYLTPKGFFKGYGSQLRTLARALGKEPEYEAKKFDPADHIGAALTVDLETEPAKNGFKEKNVVAGFLPDGQHDAMNEAMTQAVEDVEGIFADIPSSTATPES